jgi:amino acid adenylation domain-containing protein
MTSALELSDKRQLLLEKLLRKKGLEAASRPEIPRRASSGPAPLSFGQQRLWFLRQLEPANTAYNLTEAVRLRGRLDTAALERALAAITRRHEVLRTVYAPVEGTDGEPRQVVQPPAPVPLQRIRLDGLPEPVREPEAARIAGAATAQPFDLARGPVFRATLVELDRDDHLLLLFLHHIATDGWSMGLLVRELILLYGAESAGAPAPLPELPLQYADFATWQRAWLQGETLEDQLRYWRERLAGAPTRLDLPVDRPWRAVQSSRGDHAPLFLGEGTAAALRDLAREHGATLFMVLASGLAALLHRITGEDDLLVGTPASGRVRPELEKLIGFFVNTLVLRADLSGDPGISALLARIKETVLGADAHQDLPFERLIDALELPRDLSRSPLFQVMLAFQNLPSVEERPGTLDVRPFFFPKHQAQFELSVSLMDTPGGLHGALEYRTELFEATTARRLARQLETLLAGIARSPASPVSQLPLLSPAEEQQLVHEWNDTTTAYAWRRERCGLHHLIEAQAARTPGAVAASCAGKTLAYAELDARANRLARHLRSLGCGPEARVAVALERSLELLAALLGILKSGAAYVPLDPDHPRERLDLMLADARPAVLLTQEHLRPGLPETNIPILALHPDGRESLGFEEDPLDEPADDLQLAYVIYTSGSTGRPKGAMVHHAGIRNRLLWMQEAFQLSPADTVLQKTPYSFDVSVWEFFWPLLAGARVAFALPGEHRDPAALAARIAAEGVTVLHFVPSMLQLFLEEPGIARCRSLRRVVASGEALTPELVRRFHQRLPGAALENLYGPTEASVDVTFQPCPPDEMGRAVPVGRPIANTRIHLMDRGGRPVPIGVAGELWVGGVNVGRGYLGRPDLTAERFVPDALGARQVDLNGAPGARLYRTGDLARHRPDGTIEYLGRIDHQVKLHGVRIELGEIESALLRHPGVREAAVAVREDRGVRRLVGYVVSAGSAAAATADELRRFLLERLPEAMVPSLYVGLDALPLSPNGKLDRKALPEPDPASARGETSFVAPETPAETAMARIWSELLDVPRVGLLDNFFSLGGDSILSIRVLAQARDQGLSMTLQQIFRYQTLGELARAVELGDGEAADELVRTAPFELVSEADRRLLPDGVEDAYPLARTQAGMLFHSELQPETAVYHDVVGNTLRGPFAEALLRLAIERAAARHPLLRTSFHLGGFSEPLQLVHATAPVRLAVEDLRALPDDEARQAAYARWTEEERQRGFDWTHPPLVRFQVHLLDDERFIFSLSFHHAVLDGWSLASLLTELFRTYMTLRTGPMPPEPPPATSFGDFVRLERRMIDSPEARAFWERRLEQGVLNRLPRWPRSSTEAPRARDLMIGVNTETAGKLIRLAQALSVPLKSVLLAVHLRVVGFLSGESDVTIGLVTHGRPDQTGGDQVLGLFLNTLPLRVRLGAGSWEDLVLEAFAAEREILPYRRYPLADLQAMRSEQRLFETSFGFNHFHVYQQTLDFSGLEALGGYGYEETDIPFQASFFLALGGALGLRLNYLDAEFSPEQVEWAAGLYIRALDALAADPAARYGEVPLLAPDERRQILTDWSAGDAPAGISRPVDELIAEQAARTPAAPAVLADGLSLSFAGLEERANRMARYLRRFLRRRGVGTEWRVGICLERSPDLVVAVLAVLKAGAAYVPLDPGHPVDRRDALLADAGVSLLLDRHWLAAAAPDIAAESPEPLASHAPSEAAAYVIYTSGSTGRPKGVVVPHGGLCNYLRWATASYMLPEAGGSLLHSSIGFDLTVTSLFVPLLAGRPVHLVPESDGIETLAAALAEPRWDGQLAFIKLTPSHARALAQELPAGSGLTAARSLILGGEGLLAEDLGPWRRWAPETQICNEYGPTEAVVGCSLWTARAGALGPGPVPIGRPIAGARLLLLDEYLELVAPGTPGELWIGGVCLARGYLGRPDQTADRFRPDPFGPEPGGRLYRTGDLARWRPDRALEYLGRSDDQVKIRGYRIEPAEVEAALARHPDAREAAVVVRPADPEAGRELQLVGFAVPRDPASGLTADSLRTALASWLPAHMIPARIVIVPALPLTPNGKVDRRGLLDHEALREGEGTSYVAPRTPTEERLAALWAEGLGLERVGIRDSFLALGGHSLLAIQIMRKVRDEFGVKLPLRTLYSAQTVENLAVALVKAQAEKAGADVLAELLREVEQMSTDSLQAALSGAEMPKTETAE